MAHCQFLSFPWKTGIWILISAPAQILRKQRSFYIGHTTDTKVNDIQKNIRSYGIAIIKFTLQFRCIKLPFKKQQIGVFVNNSFWQLSWIFLIKFCVWMEWGKLVYFFVISRCSFYSFIQLIALYNNNIHIHISYYIQRPKISYVRPRKHFEIVL